VKRASQLWKKWLAILAGGAEVVISPEGMSEDIVAVRRPEEDLPIRGSLYPFVDRWAVQGPDGEQPE
jgi:hypothetical protein